MTRALHLYSGNLFGGVETLLLTLAGRRDTSLPLEQSFALCFEGRLSEALERAHAPLHRLGAVRISRPTSVFLARRKLRALLRTYAFDVAICHGGWALGAFGCEARRAGVPLALWVHGPMNRHHWLDRWWARPVPDLVVANSRFTAGSVRHLYPGARTEVIYCPVEPSVPPAGPVERARTRAGHGTSMDARVIVHVGRMEPWKGQTLLLEALSMLRDVPRWMCWLVGGAQRPTEGRYVAALRETVERFGLSDRVRFLGERDDIRRLLAAGDISCQPNLEPEPFGLALVEALSAGLPVVATASGGALEIVDDSCGILCRPGSATHVASSLRRLLQNETLRETLGKAGPARAAELCDPTRQVRRLTETLEGMARPSARVAAL